jgi:hypothetical protein
VPIPSLDQFLGAAEARQRIIDAFSSEVSEQMPEIIGRLLDLIDQYLADGGEALSLGELSSVATFGDLLDLVSDAGLGDLTETMRERLTELSDKVADSLRLGGLKTGQLTLDSSALEALIDYKVREAIETIALPIVKEVQTAWISSTFTGKPIREAMAEVGAALVNSTPAQAETLVGTAFNAIDRGVTAGTVDASDPDIVYLYIGPSPDDGDRITRKTCIHIVNKYFTRDQISRMENGQIADVFLHGGGWNCRHSWQPLSLEVADETGLTAGTSEDIEAFNAAGRR